MFWQKTFRTPLRRTHIRIQNTQYTHPQPLNYIILMYHTNNVRWEVLFKLRRIFIRMVSNALTWNTAWAGKRRIYIPPKIFMWMWLCHINYHYHASPSFSFSVGCRLSICYSSVEMRYVNMGFNMFSSVLYYQHKYTWHCWLDKDQSTIYGGHTCRVGVSSFILRSY